MVSVRKIMQKIKNGAMKGETIVLKGSDGQKLKVPLHPKDLACMDIIELSIDYAKKSGIPDPTIKDVLTILIDSYWWLQTLTLVFNDDEDDITERKFKRR